MNRAERRRIEKETGKKQQPPKTFTMTEDSLEGSLMEIAERATLAERERILKLVIHEYSLAVAMVAHDKLGFGGVRLKRFLSDIMEMWDSIDKGLVSMKDLEETLLQETGVEVK